MAQVQETNTVIPKREAERPSNKCQHRNKKYVVNEVEFKIWRCSDCGLLQKEAE